MVGFKGTSTSLSQEQAERFWSRVDKTDTCWLWTAGRFQNGYGRFKANRCDRGAHAVSYELSGMEIPVGLELDHLCRVRECVNPDHLEPVPPAMNVLRGNGLAAQNAAKTACKRGHPLDRSDNKSYSPRARTCRRCMVINVTKRRLQMFPGRTTNIPEVLTELGLTSS